MRKLEMGLTVASGCIPGKSRPAAQPARSQGARGSLAGLDGVLIGLRTRALLLSLLEARCRLSTVVLLIEDLHWIDSVSQEVLGKIVDGEAKLRLLILHTRRPEYEPPWREKPSRPTLRLELLRRAKSADWSKRGSELSSAQGAGSVGDGKGRSKRCSPRKS